MIAGSTIYYGSNMQYIGFANCSLFLRAAFLHIMNTNTMQCNMYSNNYSVSVAVAVRKITV